MAGKSNSQSKYNAAVQAASQLAKNTEAKNTTSQKKSGGLNAGVKGSQETAAAKTYVTQLGKEIEKQLANISSGTAAQTAAKQTSAQKTGNTGLTLGQWGAQTDAPLTNRALTGNSSNTQAILKLSQKAKQAQDAQKAAASTVLNRGGGTFLGGGGDYTQEERNRKLTTSALGKNTTGLTLGSRSTQQTPATQIAQSTPATQTEPIRSYQDLITQANRLEQEKQLLIASGEGSYATASYDARIRKLRNQAAEVLAQERGKAQTEYVRKQQIAEKQKVVQALENQDKTFWSDWDWMAYDKAKADLRTEEWKQSAGNIGWSKAAAKMNQFLNMREELDALDAKQVMSGLSDEEAGRFGKLASAYNAQVEKYQQKPASYSTDNIGNWMDRAYYLSLKTNLTDAEKEEIRQIISVIEPKTAARKLSNGDNGDYYNQLKQADATEGLALLTLYNTLEARLTQDKLGSAFGQGVGSYFNPMSRAAAVTVRENAGDSEASKKLADVLQYGNTGLQLGEAYANKNGKLGYTAGQLATGIALMHGMGAIASGTGALLGTAGGALLENGTLIASIAKMGKVGEIAAKFIPRAAMAAATVGMTSAVENMPAVASGELSKEDYDWEVLKGVGAGAAGSALSQAVESVGLSILNKGYRNQYGARTSLDHNRLALRIVQTVSAMAFGGGDSAVRELADKLHYKDEYQMNTEAILTNALISAAFGWFESGITIPKGKGEIEVASKVRPEVSREEILANKYFGDCETAGEARKRWTEYTKKYHPDASGTEATRETWEEITAAYNWFRENGTVKAATAGEQARERKAEAESRGDTKAAEKADAEMKDAIRTLNEYATDPETGIVENEEAREALEILNKATAAESLKTAPAANNLEKGLEGGTINETIQQKTAAAEPGISGPEEIRSGQGEQTGGNGATDIRDTGADTGTALTLGAREGLADGSKGRELGGRTGGQIGRLDEDAGAGSGVAGSDTKGRNDFGKSLGDAVRQRVSPISTKALGIASGTDSATVYPIPTELLPNELSDKIYGVEAATGCSLEFFAGPLEFVGDDGTVYYADGFVDLDNMRIGAQVDGDYEPWQVVEHEVFHPYADRDEWLVPRIRDRILEKYGRRELAEVVKGYIKKRRGVHNMESGPIDLISRDAEEILEEIFADANGMMNKFGLGAQKYFLDVADELNQSREGRATGKTSRTGRLAYSIDEKGNVVVDREINQEDVKQTLQDIYDGKYKKAGFTFPILKNTPQVFIDYCHLDGDRSFVMWSGKAYKAMQNNAEHQHALGVNGLMQVIQQLYTPEYIVHQNVGQNAGHDVAIVTIGNGETVAAVDLGSYRTGDHAIDGEDGFYNVLITAFQPDDEYLEKNIFNEENDVLYDRSIDKQYKAPEYVAPSETQSGRTSEALSAKSITPKRINGNNKFSIAEVDERTEPVSAYKAEQMRALEASGNVPEEYTDWFSDPEDIYTYAEALDDPTYDHEQYRRDFTRTQAAYALRDGSITVYSAGELRPGVFVTPSRAEAAEHAEGEELQRTRVPLESVAWMSPFAGLYTGENPVANINNAEYNNYTPYDQPHWSADETALEEHHWPENFPQVMFQTTTSALKNSRNGALHTQAKNGDRQAADQLVQNLIKPERLQEFAEQYKDALIVPVRGEGAGSKNKIPYAYAEALEEYGMKVDEQIIQVQKAGHTSSEGIHRLMAHSAFDGEVIPGQDYVLLDDVMTFGGTLNDLRDYIESNGGHVVACTTLAVGRNGSYLAVQPKTVEEIYSKFGKDEINNLLREAGIAHDAESLTDRQARYIQNTDLFTLRDRIDAEKASGGYSRGQTYTPREPGERSAKEILAERAASGRPQRRRRVFYSISDGEPGLFSAEDEERFGAAALDRAVAEHEAGLENEEEPAGIRDARYGGTGVALNGKDRIGITYAFAPLDSLTVSNATDGTVNPDYPQELQPRDRTRTESLRETMSMANNIQPERLEKNADVASGAPVVRSDGVVIAGNGRSMALSMAYGLGKADGYVQYLKDHASEWGLSPEDVPEDRPVLVRVADEGQDWEQLARDSNVSTVAAMSDSEQARSDAKNLKQHPEVLDKLIPDENGELNTADNRAFIADFINKVIPEAERGEMRTDNGLLSQRGLKRVQHAIFELAYEDASLLERLSERLDNDMKNVTNALLSAAPQVVAFENAVDKGERYDVGLRQYIKDAVELYRSAKEKGETVAQRTANLGFDENVDDWVIYIARFIEKNKGSGKQLRTMLSSICDTADELGDPNQVGFFEDDTDDKSIETVLKGAIRKYEDATGRTLPKPERWGAGTLEELQETTGLTGQQLEDYYLRDERGVGAQPDGRSEGEREEEPAGSDGLSLASSIGEDGHGGSDLGRERDGGGRSGSGRDDGGRVSDVVEGSLEPEAESEEPGGLRPGAAEEKPEARDKTGAERILEQRRKDQRTSERNRERNKHQRTQFPDYNDVPEDASVDFRKIAEEIRSRAATEKAERQQHVSKKDFFGTEALKKLGVKIEGALGNYRNTKQLREIEKASFQLKKAIRKAEKDLNVTEKEKQIANGIAAGIYTLNDFGPEINKGKVEALADYYAIERTINEDMILERRRQITGQLAADMREMLPDDPGYKIPPMFVMNHRTPERLCRQIFGDEKGKEVYDRIFRPVAVNEAEKIRFINRQFNDVREIAGRDGKRSELTKEERMLVQQVLEGRAAAELVAGMELQDGRQRIEDAAQNILNGTEAADTARDLGLDSYERGVAEQYARWLQTKAIYDSGDFDTVKIDNAVKIYSEKYDQFYDAINDFLVAHGYKPIGFIKGYAPHMQMQEDLNVFAGYLKSLGINEDVTRLPANIAGQTANYKPNKRWNPFFLSRSGNAADFDIAQGFQSYVTYLADVLFHTDDIMRLRAMSRHHKEAYAPEEIKENLSWARNVNSAAPEVKREELQSRGILSRDAAVSTEEVNERFDKWIEEQFDNIKNTTKYSDLVMYLDNYANILAGKQSMSDRGGEYDWGRESLTRANKIITAFARTQVAANLSSAISQFSQIPMISAEVGQKYVLQAIRDYLSGSLRKAGFAQESDHLTERAGESALVTDGFEMAMEKLFTPLRMIDGLTATIAVRAKYLQQIAQGKSHEEAMREADAYAKRVQGSRAKGSKPLAFHSKKLVNQMLHMFQLELFNSWEHVSQDLPADFREIERTQGKSKAATALAMVILKYLLAAFILNRTTEELTGGTPAPFDLLGLTANFIASGYGLTTNRYLLTAIDNAMEKMFDERILQTDPEGMRDEFNWEDAISGAGYEIVSDIPYLRNIMGLLGVGDQTLPIPLMGAGDDLKYLWKDINRDIQNGSLSGQTGMDLFRIINQAIPGGRQAVKTAEGIQLMAQGGRYINGQLYYPVENTVANWAKAILFGRSALEESDAYYAGDDKKLTVGATEIYKMLTDKGSAGRREAYEALQSARSLNEDQTEFLRNYAEGGGDSWTLWQSMQQYKEAANDKTLGIFEKGRQTRAAVTEADLTDEERLALYRVMDKDNAGKADKLETIMSSGLSWAEAVRAYDAYAEIEANENLSKKEQAEQWASWVNHQDYSADQKEAIRDTIKFWGSYAIEDTTTDKLSGAGLSADSTDELTKILNSLEPEPGRDKVTDLQKYTAIANSSMSIDDQWKAIIGITPESYTSTLDKITIMQDYGIAPSVWTESKKAMYDADDAGNDNDSTDQKEARAALDEMDIPNDQKAILWQLTNKSWSWKNNPYDTDIGQEIYALLHEGDTGSSSSKKKSGGGGRRGGGGGGKKTPTLPDNLVLGEAFNTGHRGIYDSVLVGWKRRKYSKTQILAMVRAGILTQEEADEILATAQDEEATGGLMLGAAEEMSA